MMNYPVWRNHQRLCTHATQQPHADSHITGWDFNNAGRHVSPKVGFRDDITESDWRGHSLDATGRIAAGCMYAGSNKAAMPMVQWIYRDDE